MGKPSREDPGRLERKKSGEESCWTQVQIDGPAFNEKQPSLQHLRTLKAQPSFLSKPFAHVRSALISVCKGRMIGGSYS